MLTYQLKKSPGVPLYEALYRCIRQDILSGKLAAGTKLPSKRALAENLEIRLVENFSSESTAIILGLMFTDTMVAKQK